MFGRDTGDDLATFVTLAAAPIFDALAHEWPSAQRRNFEQHFEVIWRPGELTAGELQPEDLLLRRGEAGFAHVSRIVAPELWPNEQLAAAGLRPETMRRGLFAHVLDYSPGPRVADMDLARLIVETNGRVPAGQMILRRRRNMSSAVESLDVLSPPPITNAHAVIDERIDVDAQFALLRMNKGDAAARQDAAGMLAAVKGTLGERMRLAGIYGDNLGKAVQIASRHGKYRWELIPKGEDSALVLEPNDPAAPKPPTILFRGGDPTAKPKPHFGIRRDPTRLDAALRNAWASFKLLRGGQLSCALPPRDGPTVFGASIESLPPLACMVPTNIFPPLQLRTHPFVVMPPILACPLKRGCVPDMTNDCTVCVRHAHVARTCTDGKSFTSAASVTLMTPETMNPGFIRTDDLVQFDKDLDIKLVKLLVETPKYAVMLSPESKKWRTPLGGDKIRVALVDLTGDKICNPGYADWDSTTPIAGGSTAKFGVLYATHQLLFDLNELVRVRGIRTEADLKTATNSLWSNLKCKPDLKWLVEFDPDRTKICPSTNLDSNGQPECAESNLDPQMTPVCASKNLETHRTQMVDASSGANGNELASELIIRLGFEYIASVLWQSGLRHPLRQGLWFGNTYEDVPRTAKPNPACHLGNKPIFWKDNPFQNSLITLTALSAATFFTLLAQGRLVNPAASKDMECLLKKGCGFMRPGPDLDIRATKCGLTKRFKHDAALFEAFDRRRRYVLVVLTERAAPNWSDEVRRDFFRDVDNLVKDHNP